MLLLHFTFFKPGKKLRNYSGEIIHIIPDELQRLSELQNMKKNPILLSNSYTSLAIKVYKKTFQSA